MRGGGQIFHQDKLLETVSTCCTLSSDPARYSLTQCFAHSFSTHWIALISGALTAPTSKTKWKTKSRSTRNCTSWHTTRALKTNLGTVLRALVASIHKSRPRDDPRPPIPAEIRDEIHLKSRLRRQWHVTRDPVLKAEVNRLQRSVSCGSTSTGKICGVRHPNPSTPKTNPCGG